MVLFISLDGLRKAFSPHKQTFAFAIKRVNLVYSILDGHVYIENYISIERFKYLRAYGIVLLHIPALQMPHTQWMWSCWERRARDRLRAMASGQCVDGNVNGAEQKHLITKHAQPNENCQPIPWPLSLALCVCHGQCSIHCIQNANICLI